jgi:hypothetical protein
MGLENSTTIDAVGTEKDTGTVVLTILDSWNWSHVDTHLRALQAKLNTYLDFVSSGQLLREYPQAAGKPARIDILFRCDAPAEADGLLGEARRVVESLGLTLNWLLMRTPDAP